MPADQARKGQDAPLFSVRAALLQELARGDGYGLGLADRLRGSTGGVVDLAEGSIYPALRRLEEDGLIEAAGEEPRGDRGGKPRKLYRITPDGQREAQRQREVAAVVFFGLEARRGETIHSAAQRVAAETVPPPAPAERWVEPEASDRDVREDG